VLKTGGALLIGFSVVLAGRRAMLQPRADFEPNAFLRIADDGAVTAIISPTEMGQGIHTALAMVLADELDAEWSSVRVEAAPANPSVYGNPLLNGLQTTEASTSMAGFYATTRQAAAAAKAMLLRAAAAKWEVPADSCRTADSFVIGPDDQRIAYGDLVAAASRLTPPLEADLQLKKSEQFKLIGRSIPRVDMRAQVTGALVYGLDVRLPRMLTAMVARKPMADAKVKSFDAEAARAMPRVRAVVEVPSGIAVIAEDYWAALSAREKLNVEWDFGDLDRFSSATLDERHRALAQSSGTVAAKQGDAESVLANSKVLMSAEYSQPHVAHTPMEPLNCTIDATPERVDVWVGSQDQGLHHALVSTILERPLDRVKIHTIAMGGAFGRRGSPDGDFVAETAEIVKATRDLKVPIRNIWSREDDIRGGFYRPMAFNQLSAALDDAGKPVAWHHRLVSRSPLARTQFDFFVADGIDASSVAGARDLPYDIPNMLVDLHSPEIGPTVQWLRAVGNSNVCFAVESFIDELAHRAGMDPFAYRRQLLATKSGSERLLRVMEAVARKASWGKPLRSGRGRGIAIHDYWGTKVAQVAEVSVSNGKLLVERVTCAIDCGLAINPDGVKAQVEGAIVFGLTAALYGEITFSDGLPEQSNFDTYPLLRMDACPVIDVIVVDSQAGPGGVGEAAVPHVAAAVCNAVFAASGKRIRTLPISRSELTV